MVSLDCSLDTWREQSGCYASERIYVKISDAMDKFGVFAAWVGIVAFFLAVPLAVIANLLTPRVASLWAKTSAARSERRIETLRKTLIEIDRLMNGFEVRIDYMIRGLRLLAVSAIGFLYLLLFVHTEILGIHAHLVGIVKLLHGAELDVGNYYLWGALYTALYLITFYHLMRAIRAFEVFSRFHLNSAKNKAERELKKLCG